MNKIIKKKKDDISSEVVGTNPSELRRLNILLNSKSEAELAHVGVLGMRWGVRKDSSGSTDSGSSGKGSSGTMNSKTVKGQSGDKLAQKTRKQVLKNRRVVSDEELTSMVNRLQMEKRLVELASKDVEPGKAVVNDIMGKFMTAAIGAAAGAAGAAVVKAAFKTKEGG